MDELATWLGHERRLLELLLFKLVEGRHLLAAGEARFLALAAGEVERAMRRVQEAELARSILVSRLAGELGIPEDDLTLSALSRDSLEPYRSVFDDHRRAFLGLVTEIEEVTRQNRRLAAQGAHDVDKLLALVGDPAEEAGVRLYGPGSRSPVPTAYVSTRSCEPMSFSSLGIGASALTAAQRAMETAAHNVANVNTEGYTRQRVELRAADPVPGTFGKRGDGMRGMGVTIADVIRVRSVLVDANYRAQASTEAAWSARAEVMGRAEQVLGPFGEGAPAALAEFWAGWEELSLHPDNPAARRGVLDAGESLARSLRSAASQLDQLAGDTAAQVREEVGEVNRLAGQIARLNAGIADATVGAQAPNDLLDERDRLLDRLSALTGATFRPADLGRVDVFLGSMALVRGESVETLHASDGVPATLGWSPGGVDNLTVGGRLGALVDGGRTTLPVLQTELDTFADDLAQLVNGHHADGWDGRQPPQAGGAFFAGTGAGGFAVAITDVSLLAASATQAGAPADGNHALVMAGLRNTQLASGDTPGDALHDFAGRLGSLAAEAFDSATASAEILAAVNRERADMSSVSTDEELTDMLRFQRAYDAAARVITTVDEMLDRLINHTGLVGR